MVVIGEWENKIIGGGGGIGIRTHAHSHLHPTPEIHPLESF